MTTTTVDAMSALPDLPCFLNGAYSAVRDAKVSVLDRGFIFGDGIYEVIPVYQGRLFRADHHFARLQRSLAEVRIANPYTQAQWTAIALNLVQQFADSVHAKVEDTVQMVYIQITRGVAARDHAMPVGITPTVFVMSNALKLPTPEQRRDGVACVTADDFRWEKAHIKSTSLLGAVLSRQISADVGATETVMFRRGWLSEASSSNVWIVKNNAVIGVQRNHLVLEGIRFSLIEELCRAKGIAFSLRDISAEEVFAADEVLLSSATKEILPVTRLDDKVIGSGKPGPVYGALYAGYLSAIQTGGIVE